MTSGQRLLFFPIVLLIVALVVFYPGLKQLPIGGLFRIGPRASAGKPAVKIWANKRTGIYYCPDSKLYGKLTPGVYMSQGEALRGGYHPAAKEACR